MRYSITAPNQEVIQRLRDKTPYAVVHPARNDDEYDDYSEVFIAVSYGGPVVAARERGIVGTRYDGKVVFWAISIYAPDPDEAAYAKDWVFDVLEGFKPSNTSELVAKSGMAFSRKRNTIRPAVYVESLSFESLTNLSLNPDPQTP